MIRYNISRFLGFFLIFQAARSLTLFPTWQIFNLKNCFKMIEWIQSTMQRHDNNARVRGKLLNYTLYSKYFTRLDTFSILLKTQPKTIVNILFFSELQNVLNSDPKAMVEVPSKNHPLSYLNTQPLWSKRSTSSNRSYDDNTNNTKGTRLQN